MKIFEYMIAMFTIWNLIKTKMINLYVIILFVRFRLRFSVILNMKRVRKSVIKTLIWCINLYDCVGQSISLLAIFCNFKYDFSVFFCFKQDSVDLGCGHGLCTDCCRSYLTTKIMDENATETIQCPVENCGKIVDSDFIMRVLTHANARQKFQRLMVNSFVQVSYWLCN